MYCGQKYFFDVAVVIGNVHMLINSEVNPVL